MHPAIFLKVNLGVVRSLKNVERIYWTAIIKVEKLTKGAELELYRESFKHYFLLLFGVL